MAHTPLHPHAWLISRRLHARQLTSCSMALESLLREPWSTMTTPTWPLVIGEDAEGLKAGAVRAAGCGCDDGLLLLLLLLASALP